MSDTNGKLSKASILTIGGLSLIAGGLVATVSITLSFASSQSSLREEITASNATVKEQIQAVKDEIGKNVQGTKDEQRAAVQSVKDEVRDRTAELGTRINDIRQKMEISELKMVDRWTGTDMKRLWAEWARVWTETKRRNPSLDLPEVPEVH